MTTTVEYEGEQIKVFAIADLPVKEYTWIIGLELGKKDVNRLGLSATDPHLNTMDRIINWFVRMGVVEVLEKSRGRKRLINPKKNELIDVNFVVIEKPAILQS